MNEARTPAPQPPPIINSHPPPGYQHYNNLMGHMPHHQQFVPPMMHMNPHAQAPNMMRNVRN